MKIEMNTNWLHIIEPGLYGTNLGDYYDNILSDYCDDFKSTICMYAKDKMNEVLNDIQEGWFGVTNVTFHSPQFYNFENDWLEFDLKVPDHIDEMIIFQFNKDKSNFLKFAAENYGSHSGFISFFPYKEEDFITAIMNMPNKQYDFNRAVGMFLMWMLRDEDFDDIQRDFEDDVIEEYYQNGWEDYFDEDEYE